MSDQTMDSHEGFAAMAATTEQHAMLEAFVGTFASHVKLWMGPGDPHESTGVMVNSKDLGGRYLKQTYTGDPNPGPFPSFEGRGYWGYNTIDKRWEGFWIDNASTMMSVEYGQVSADGKVWTMVGEMTDPMSRQLMKKRSVITLIDNDRHSMEMYFENEQGEMKGMEIQYKRKA